MNRCSPAVCRHWRCVGGALREEISIRFRKLSDAMLKKVNVTGRKTIIFECEFWVILCAMYSWKQFLSGCNVLAYIDNDGARDSLIACHCSSQNALPILDACIRLEPTLEWNVWFNRVPTESNVADDPSCLEISELQQCGCDQNHLQCENMWLLLIDERGR